MEDINYEEGSMAIIFSSSELFDFIDGIKKYQKKVFSDLKVVLKVFKLIISIRWYFEEVEIATKFRSK